MICMGPDKNAGPLSKITAEPRPSPICFQPLPLIVLAAPSPPISAANGCSPNHIYSCIGDLPATALSQHTCSFFI